MKTYDITGLSTEEIQFIICAMAAITATIENYPNKDEVIEQAVKAMADLELDFGAMGGVINKLEISAPEMVKSVDNPSQASFKATRVYSRGVH